MDAEGIVEVATGLAASMLVYLPIFFVWDGHCGYVKNTAFDGKECGTIEDQPFVMDLTLAPVNNVSQNATGQASISVTFHFIPGSKDNPTGPPFDIKVAPFPLNTLFPFY